MSPLWKPTFTISIDSDFLGKIYGSGEEIVGKIRLLDAMPELVGPIDIKLWGSIKTEQRCDMHGHGRHERLISLAECTVNAHATVLEAAESYSWPFRISFPQAFKIGDSANKVDEMLPPTYKRTAHRVRRPGGCMMIVIPDMRHRCRSDAFIEYKLTASIYMHQSQTPMYKAEKELRFSPTLPLNHPLSSPRNFDPHSQSWSETAICGNRNPLPLENRVKELSLLEQPRAISQPYQLPALKVTLTMPTILLVGSRIVVHVRVEHINNNNPEVHLQCLSVSLEALDEIETDDAQYWDVPVGAGGWYHLWSPLGAFSKNEEWTKMASITIPEHVMPTFTTYRIRRSYCLRVTASLKIADIFHRSSQEIPVKVLPRLRVAYQPSPSSDPAEASSSGQSSCRGQEEEILPTYEEALLAPVPAAPPKFED